MLYFSVFWALKYSWVQLTKLQDDDKEDRRQLKGWIPPFFQRPKKSLVTDRSPVQLCKLKKTQGNIKLISTMHMVLHVICYIMLAQYIALDQKYNICKENCMLVVESGLLHNCIRHICHRHHRRCLCKKNGPV